MHEVFVAKWRVAKLMELEVPNVAAEVEDHRQVQSHSAISYSSKFMFTFAALNLDIQMTLQRCIDSSSKLSSNMNSC